jgi:hypothetical protein
MGARWNAYDSKQDRCKIVPPFTISKATPIIFGNPFKF